MKKKGALDYVLLVSIIAIVVLIVLFRLDTLILNIIKGTGDDFGCVFTASFQSMTKNFGIAPTKLHCQRQQVTIVLTKKDKEISEAKNKEEKYYALDKPIPNQELKEVLERYNLQARKIAKNNPEKLGELTLPSNYFTDDENAKKHLYQYRMDEAVANEMKSCWNKLGRGELELFSDWGIPVKFEKDSFNGNWAHDLWDVVTWPLDIYIKRGKCVVCSRIIFDKKVNSEFENMEITTLPRWMQVHPVKVINKKPISYYEFLLDESIPVGFFESSQDTRYYYKNDNPYVVVFKRTSLIAPLGTLKKIFNKVLSVNSASKFIVIEYGGGSDGDSDTGKMREMDEAAIDMVYLLPYEELYNDCDSVEN